MSTYEISKSSLLSLKAEILRKQQELTKVKSDNEKKIKIIKKNTPLEFKNKHPTKDNDEIGHTPEDEQCEVLLKLSRHVLEHKSALYERLRSGSLTCEEEKQSRNYLVQFDTKIKDFEESSKEVEDCPESDYEDQLSEDDIDPSEKWVDYVDCLGRTRKCLQKDLEFLKANDNELKKVVEAKKRTAHNTSNTDNTDDNTTVSSADEQNVNADKQSEALEAELLSSDMRREMLREQWEKEEEQLKKKSDIHYQDVLFGEARTHGVGYYGFSKNEDERLKQQEALKKLRHETEQKQKRAQELKLMRENKLAARIKAAQDRKRARLGLPPEEIELETVLEAKRSEEETQKQRELERLKEEREKILEDARKHHLRPWDVGKEGVTKEHHEMTQDEWSAMKRSERITEFAPPASYTERKDIKNNDNSKKKHRMKKNEMWRKERASIIKNSPNLIQKDQEVDANHFKNRESTTNISNSSNSDSDYSHRPFRGQGTEIPPPLNFEYFGPTPSKLNRTSKRNDINESIEAGLRFLRKQMEEKARNSY